MQHLGRRCFGLEGLALCSGLLSCLASVLAIIFFFLNQDRLYR